MSFNKLVEALPMVFGVPVTPSSKKFIYITGCDSGFGAASVKALDALGFGVIAGCYLEPSLTRIKNEQSANVIPIQVDVSKESSVNDAAKEIEEIVNSNGGVLHGLVNNAGILLCTGPTEWTPTMAFRRMLDVNVMGSIMTAKSLLPLIRKSQGRIVQVSSAAGMFAPPAMPGYCTSKFAIEGFCDVLRRDMYPFGVTVHVIEPGVCNTTPIVDNIETEFTGMWKSLPEAVKSDYGEEYRDDALKGLNRFMIDLADVKLEQVVDSIVHALTSGGPKYRYKLGFLASTVGNFMSKMHESIQDGEIALVAKPAAGAPQNAVSMAYSRYHKNYAGMFAMLAIIITMISLFAIRMAIC